MSIYDNERSGKYQTETAYPGLERDPLIKRRLIKEYHADQQRVMNLFKSDALKELGLFGHAKADKLFSIAWEHGHAHGFMEVWEYMVDLAELLRD